MRGRLIVLCGVWLALRQIDLVLASLQSTGGGGYGANAFVGMSPRDLPHRVNDLLSVWEGTRPVSHVAFGVYTAIDCMFVAVYVWVFLSLFARLDVPLPDGTASPTQRAVKRAKWWVFALAGFDLLENVLRAVIVGWHKGSAVLVYGSWALSTAKFLALLGVLLLLFVAWRQAGLAAGPGRLSASTAQALGRLRVPLVLLGVWGLFVIFDPTGQSADILRRWLDSRAQFIESAVFTMIAGGLLGLATWTTVRRMVLADYTTDIEPLSPSWKRWTVTLAILGGAAYAGWLNLLGFVSVILLVFALTALARWWRIHADDGQDATWTQQVTDAAARRALLRAPPDGFYEDEVRRVTRAMATWPLVALLLAITSAWTAPAVVLLAQQDDERRAIPAAILAVVALASAVLVAHGVPSGLRAWEAHGAVPTRTHGIEYRHVTVALLCAVLAATAILWPLDVPGFLGAFAMTAVIFAVLLIALGEGQRYGDLHPPPDGLTMVGFRRLPVTLLLVTSFVIASFFNSGSYHDVYRNDSSAPPRAGTALASAFGDWIRRNCANVGPSDRAIPMVFVSAPGGGMRAAYWSASVLTELLSGTLRDPHCDHATALGRIFVMGGASGGSVGITSYLGNAGAEGRWYRNTMGDSDFVAVPTTWGLLVDMPRNLIGFSSPDRARRFEEAWERQDATLKADFFIGQGGDTPLLILAGTQVESGCRMSISALRLAAESTSSDQAECGALLTRVAVSPGVHGPGRVAPLTSDILDYLCKSQSVEQGESLNRSTASLLSSRFPYVSPSGRLVRCNGGRATAVGDAGYSENTGTQQVLSLWERLEPLVADHNANADIPRVVPIFVEIDNHYAKAAGAAALARTQELLVPLVTKARADKLDDRGVEQLANSTFSLDVPGRPGETCTISDMPGYPTRRYILIAPGESPGIPAPLAWTLSRMAMDDLDRQREAAFARRPTTNKLPARDSAPTQLKRILAGGRPSCTHRSPPSRE